MIISELLSYKKSERVAQHFLFSPEYTILPSPATVGRNGWVLLPAKI